MCKSCISDNKSGRIELIIGCMFAGKTEEFLRRMKRLEYAKLKTVIFKPIIDDRHLKHNIVSHNNIYANCKVIKSSKDILKYVQENPNLNAIGIDEVQFFDLNLVKVVNDLADKNYIIILNGLDLDFKSMPFKTTMNLMPIADFITKLHAICIKCGNYANRTQRIINGKPASINDKIILIGSEENYEARCRSCYEIK